MKFSQSKLFRSLLIYAGILTLMVIFILTSVKLWGTRPIHYAKIQWRPSTPDKVGLIRDKIYKAIYYTESKLPAAESLIVIKNDKTVLEKYYGRGEPKKTSPVFSVGNSIMSALVGIALEKNLLEDINQPLTDFFPDAARKLNLSTDSMSIRTLLTTYSPMMWGDKNTAYWQLFYAQDKTEAALKLLSDETSQDNPAKNLAISFLLAKIIEQVSSMTVFEFANKNLFTPMGVSTLEGLEEKQDDLTLFTGLQLKAMDLAKFGYLHLKEGYWDDQAVIPSDWVKSSLGFESVDKNGYGFHWQTEKIGQCKTYQSQGEGGQFIVLIPKLDMVVSVTSKSQLPLQQANGQKQLFQIIANSGETECQKEAPAIVLLNSSSAQSRGFGRRRTVLQNEINRGSLDEVAKKTASAFGTEAKTVFKKEESYKIRSYKPTFVSTTEVPEEIKNFFIEFSRDLLRADPRLIARHYAKGFYYNKRNFKTTMKIWMMRLYVGPVDLEAVSVEKFRQDGNRAYLRGFLRYAFTDIHQDEPGVFPIRNLIKVNGKWKWYGTPDYTELLDRESYFDASVPEAVKHFIDGCAESFLENILDQESSCFARDFLFDGISRKDLLTLLQPVFKNGNDVEMHFTRFVPSQDSFIVDGYIQGSDIGTLRLPPGMRIKKQATQWRWAGNQKTAPDSSTVYLASQ